MDPGDEDHKHEDQSLMDRAVKCFENGDFAQARRIAHTVLSRTSDEALKAEAESLLERTAPDRLALALGVFCLVLILVLGAVYL